MRSKPLETSWKTAIERKNTLLFTLQALKHGLMITQPILAGLQKVQCGPKIVFYVSFYEF